jgi:hypothetical protein
MDTWELDNPSEEFITFLRLLKGFGNIERLDDRYVNVTVEREATDDLVMLCEENGIECRLV